jgi:hypothetical protein
LTVPSARRFRRELMPLSLTCTVRGLPGYCRISGVSNFSVVRHCMKHKLRALNLDAPHLDSAGCRAADRALNFGLRDAGSFSGHHAPHVAGGEALADLPDGQLSEKSLT